MNQKIANQTRKTTVKGVHGIVAEPNITKFLQAMADFDAAAGKGRKLHLATNLINQQ